MNRIAKRWMAAAAAIWMLCSPVFAQDSREQRLHKVKKALEPRKQGPLLLSSIQNLLPRISPAYAFHPAGSGTNAGNGVATTVAMAAGAGTLFGGFALMQATVKTFAPMPFLPIRSLSIALPGWARVAVVGSIMAGAVLAGWATHHVVQ